MASNNRVMKRLSKRYSPGSNNVDFPETIEVQTASYCNGKCILCPHKRVSEHLPSGVMSDSLFRRIISQVSLSKRIIPYFNNEPFMDPRFMQRLHTLKKLAPEAEIEIATNASLLSREKQNELVEIPLQELRLSIFGFSKDTYSRIMTGLNWKKTFDNLHTLIRNQKLRDNIEEISIVMIDFPLVPRDDREEAKRFCEEHGLTFHLWGFMDRSGNVEGYSNNVWKEKVSGCEQDRPLKRLHVTFQGKVVLCCMDWKQEYILGDLTKNSVNDVWTSKDYNEIRKRIYGNTSDAPKLCKRCILAR